jgi:dTDP-4-amino-4,6-dideoxygalactose transaminase
MQTSRYVPMARPNPPRLSNHVKELARIENSNIFSNFGPMATNLEQKLAELMFQSGSCLSVCNATLGLMIAIRSVLWKKPISGRRFALMPSFTFAATAHAALWNGLTPLLCDIDPETWLPSASSEEALLEEYGEQVAVIVPCATFGNALDLTHYDDLHERYGVGVVVDAAAALGSLGEDGRSFGDGSRWPIVYSMHATKPFAIGEGGIIYCADAEQISQLRAMACFGFERPRAASLPGLNAKMSEVAALTGLLQLNRFEKIIKHRHALKDRYLRCLPTWSRQRTCGSRQVPSYESVLLPEEFISTRPAIMEELHKRHIGMGSYFSPHLAEQPYFAASCVSGSLPITSSISRRVMTLPMYDSMTAADVRYVAEHTVDVVQTVANDLKLSIDVSDEIYMESRRESDLSVPNFQ